ncbi:lipid-binding SYLF domain-containing protein [Massilia sp. TW-1]|uniref:Lipid-binding SYLF domain-containing protein n=1 Tax=Telluria antibiotica TaxID=2717319 RepID=A0ABX0P6Y7_9BURK|nr:lipid-binding SYLF domain-containing protein [Telluria antibiotica]NIA53016.1 lipid-binding SYLF domain-containing protein [Telluria antibiotica]
MNKRHIRVLQGLCAALLAGPLLAPAQDKPAAPADTTSSAERHNATAERHVMQAVDVVHRMELDAGIRPLLARSKGVFIVPAYTRAAIGIGAEGGAGLLLLHDAEGRWSGPVFYNTGGVSLGLQVGAQGGMLAFVLNNQKAVDAFLKKTSVSLNAKAGLTIVNWNRMVQGAAGAGDVVAWSNSRGVFGDAATIELSGVRYSQNLNDAYYHRTLSASDIIAGKTGNSQAGLLVQTLASATQP